MVYIVTYDLCSEIGSESYNKLINLIKECGVWAKLGGSSYLIESELSAVDLRNKYRTVLDSNDKLYVGAVIAPAAWTGYNSEISQWIRNKLG